MPKRSANCRKDPHSSTFALVAADSTAIAVILLLHFMICHSKKCHRPIVQHSSYTVFPIKTGFFKAVLAFNLLGIYRNPHVVPARIPQTRVHAKRHLCGQQMDPVLSAS